MSCYLRTTAGNFKVRHKEEDVIVIQTEICTIIALYIRPQTATEEVIEIVMTAISKTEENEKIILVGDINCRIDKDNIKTEMVMAALREEGYKLANKKDMMTYVAPNGSSAIDILLYKGEKIRAIEQKGLWNSNITPLRKHIPIETTMEIVKEGQRKGRIENQKKKSRILDPQRIRHNNEEIEIVRGKIEEGQIEAAIEMMNNIIKNACQDVTRRKAQPWFNKVCFEERKASLKALGIAKTTNRKEDLQTYARKRKHYKATIKEARGKFMEEEADRNPFLPIKRRTKQTMREIPIQEWEKHFSRILNKGNKKEAYEITTQKIEEAGGSKIELTEEEVDRCIRAAKSKKATGPDHIANEHLKSSAEMLTPIWTEIFNKCISTNTVPEKWRKATLKILYKGKGNAEDLHAYRGVALENTSYKIFMKIITNKLTEITKQYIPENQFGFRKAKSTLQAAEAIMKEIDEALDKPKGKYFAIFID